MTKLILVLALAAIGPADFPTIEVKDGKPIATSGCLQRNPGGGYMLMDGVGALQYTLVTDKDLTPHLNRWVTIRGKATDRGGATLKFASVAINEHTGGTIEATTELKGDLGLHYLGVESVEPAGSSCALGN